jgi:hypothetical protein
VICLPIILTSAFRHEDNIVHNSVQRSIYLALLSRLIEQLDERFPDYDFLKALVVLFGPDSLRSEAAQSADYGEEELAFVLDHYGRALQKNDLSTRVRLEWRTAGDNPELGGAAAAHEEKQADEEEGLVIPPFVDSKVAKLEWAVARRTLIARVQAWSGEEPMRVADVLAILISDYAAVFPELGLVSVAASAICVVTVANERSFSDMKLHTPRLRNRLGDIRLVQPMRISLEGPEGPMTAQRSKLSSSASWIGVWGKRIDGANTCQYPTL